MSIPAMIAPGRNSIAYDSSLTFAGVLRAYFEEIEADTGKNVGISQNWHAQSTIENDVSDYNNRILPALDKLGIVDLPLAEYTKDDFDAYMSVVDQWDYKDSTKAHYRHLFKVVYDAGVTHDLYPDMLFLDNTTDDSVSEEAKSAALFRIRKSFSKDEVLKLLKWAMGLDPVMAAGEDIGLLNMFFHAPRGNESCGVNYGNIHELSGYEHINIMDISESTEINSNETKASGKTSNSPRFIPILPFFYDFLMKRKAAIQAKIESGEIILPPDIKGIAEVPIVCKGTNYTERVGSKALTIAGRKLFEKIGIGKSELAQLYKILMEEEFRSLELDEREPTTYLFRRNAATNYYLLGYTLPEIQYLIGHEIDDPNIKRGDFADPDKLNSLGVRMLDHPFNALLGYTNDKTAKIKDDNCFFEEELLEEVSVEISTEEDEAVYLLEVKMREPGQLASIDLHSDGGSFISGYIQGYKAPADRTVDVKRIMCDAYKKDYKHIK